MIGSTLALKPPQRACFQVIITVHTQPWVANLLFHGLSSLDDCVVPSSLYDCVVLSSLNDCVVLSSLNDCVVLSPLMIVLFSLPWIIVFYLPWMPVLLHLAWIIVLFWPPWMILLFYSPWMTVLFSSGTPRPPVPEAPWPIGSYPGRHRLDRCRRGGDLCQSEVSSSTLNSSTD